MKLKLTNVMKKNDVLSLIVEEKRKHKRRESVREKFGKFFARLYVPSGRNLLIVVLAVAIFFIFSWTSYKSIPRESNMYQNLIAVLAGISAIIFALVIFVTESAQTGREPDKMRVLLRQSYLFPITISVILTFIFLLVGYANYLTATLIGIIGFFTILSIKNVISVLLDKSLFLSKITVVLNERIESSIKKEADKRLGNSILLSHLNGDASLTFNPLIENKNEKYIAFRAEESGVIINIDIGKLKEFSDLALKEANRNGYGFKEKADNFCYLTKGFGWKVKSGETLILLNKNLVKNQVTIERLKTLTSKSFTIKNVEGSSEEIEREIAGLGEWFTEAIRNRHISIINDIEKIYITFIEAFWKHILRYGTETYGSMLHEKNSFLSELQEVQWISRDYRRFLKEAVETNDSEVIDSVFYLSMELARLSVKNKDEIIFREFMQFSGYLYEYASKSRDKTPGILIANIICRHIKELINFDIIGGINSGTVKENELNLYKGFIIYILYKFQRLLKTTFDRKDIASFETFLNTTKELFDNFHMSNESNDLEVLQNEISTKKEHILFGIASLIFDKLLNNKNDPLTKEFYEQIQNAFNPNFTNLTRIYLDCLNAKSVITLSWDGWDTSEHKVYTNFQFAKKLTEFFIAKSLLILSEEEDAKIGKLKLSYKKELARLINNENSDLNVILNSIIVNPKAWQPVLPANALSKAPLLKDLLKKNLTETE